MLFASPYLLGLPDELFAAHYPAASCGDAAVSFDAAVHSALSRLTGNHIDASQWEQAGFALRDGGLGMRLGCCPSGLSEGDSCPLSGSPCGPPLRRTHSWQLDCRSHGPLACCRHRDATPSKTLDKQLSNAEFSLEVSLRLGVDVFEGGLPCPFCGLLLGSPGHPVWPGVMPSLLTTLFGTWFTI